jgi:hypothetical protein
LRLFLLEFFLLLLISGSHRGGHFRSKSLHFGVVSPHLVNVGESPSSHGIEQIYANRHENNEKSVKPVDLYRVATLRGKKATEKQRCLDHDLDNPD